MTTPAYKKVQYGYHGKNCLVSDHTERTLCEIYSSVFYLQPEGYEGVSVYGGGYGGVENSGSTSFSKVL